MWDNTYGNRDGKHTNIMMPHDTGWLKMRVGFYNRLGSEKFRGRNFIRWVDWNNPFHLEVFILLSFPRCGIYFEFGSILGLVFGPGLGPDSFWALGPIDDDIRIGLRTQNLILLLPFLTDQPPPLSLQNFSISFFLKDLLHHQESRHKILREVSPLRSPSFEVRSPNYLGVFIEFGI